MFIFATLMLSHVLLLAHVEREKMKAGMSTGMVRTFFRWWNRWNGGFEELPTDETASSGAA